MGALSPESYPVDLCCLRSYSRVFSRLSRLPLLSLPMNLQRYRKTQLTQLSKEIGVYALCDLDCVPIYVGQSVDGIRARVHRHLTSARSDVIANRQLDVWEVAYVWAWPMPGQPPERIRRVEYYLANEYHPVKPLMGKISAPPLVKPRLPKRQEVMVLPLEEIVKRQDPLLRLPRQAMHFNSLFSHILEVKDNEELRAALAAHFDRLQQYYENFMKGPEKSPETD